MVYRLKKKVLLSEIATILNNKVIGMDQEIHSVASFDNSSKKDLTFCNEFNALTDGCLITNTIPKDFPSQSAFIQSDHPRLDFIKSLDFLNKKIGFSHHDFISEIDPSCVLGENVVIESGCKIGKGVIIEHNTTIHSGTIIGDNSRIRSNCSIGGEGFGFETLPDGSTIRFVHLGGVKIGENVEIGALNSVVRGTLGDTVIHNYVKTDNLVHIAHNCIIGKGSLITACAEISGSVKIGENAWLGPNCSINNKIEIGDQAFIGLGATVTKSIPKKEIWAGNPARFIKKVN
jgi:UDP-3-O-[3-hydroxymyristoyl] glucosamine N-acyltransferase